MNILNPKLEYKRFECIKPNTALDLQLLDLLHFARVKVYCHSITKKNGLQWYMKNNDIQTIVNFSHGICIQWALMAKIERENKNDSTWR